MEILPEKVSQPDEAVGASVTKPIGREEEFERSVVEDPAEEAE